MTLRDALDVGQSDPSAFGFVEWMQPLKNAKQFVRVFHVEADSVIADEKNGLLLRLRAADLDDRLGARAGVFQRIGKEVDYRLPKHERVALHFGQRPDLPDDVAPFDIATQFLARSLD